MGNVYKKFSEEELILRDHLALDRTILANERTFLAYVRTTLAVIVVGATILHFSEDSFLDSLGALCIIAGIIILIIGSKRTMTMSRAIYAKKRRRE
jgi:putative membrane protein